MELPPIVSEQAWQEARDALLVKEKELTHARDAMAAERRRMPRMLVEKEYEFEGPDGRVSLLDMFEGRRQLIIYRFFYEPGVSGWPEKGCPGCSMVADQIGHPAHLRARDTVLARVSRAPQADIRRLKEKMGWDVPWYTVIDDFDKDFGVGEWHGTNVFLRVGDRIYRTYFVDGRGDEALGSTFTLPRHRAARASGGMGGLARGLPAGRFHVVAAPRRVRAQPAGAAARRGDPDRRRRALSRRSRERDVTPLAHVAGVPVEELVLTAAGAGSALLVARTWVWSRLRGRRGGPA